MSYEITVPEIFEITFALVISISLLSGILFVSNPTFLEAKTLLNEMSYVEIVSNEEMETKFLSENEDILLSSDESSYSIEIKDRITFDRNEYTSESRFTESNDYIVLS